MVQDFGIVNRPAKDRITTERLDLNGFAPSIETASYCSFLQNTLEFVRFALPSLKIGRSSKSLRLRAAQDDGRSVGAGSRRFNWSAT